MSTSQSGEGNSSADVFSPWVSLTTKISHNRVLEHLRSPGLWLAPTLDIAFFLVMIPGPILCSGAQELGHLCLCLLYSNAQL